MDTESLATRAWRMYKWDMTQEQREKVRAIKCPNCKADPGFSCNMHGVDAPFHLSRIVRMQIETQGVSQ